ncbi:MULTISPECIES: hypothetical protein [Flavobacteriaceae]|uniref:Uncharacterized protein n=2 Tax=Flavobacteriaceae TaxID=49546 RepID=A0A2T0MB07_9FLAO|nr:hypothetical protein [Allomuricauda pacifica]PRX54676.1 hypothetical protein CLV81_3079 [Allomuricauda pacifica]
MEKVNYIIHLNAILEKFNRDTRIKQGHITLYLAFFHKWNRDYFKKRITVNRGLIMERAKIRSKTTYHNYLKDLNCWGYLKYLPSKNPSLGSKIHMFNFGTSASTLDGQKMDNTVPELGQNLVPYIKHKTIRKLNKEPNLNFNKVNILSFFKENNWPAIEGEKFYIYLRTKKWKTEKWKAMAHIFAKNNFRLNEPERGSPFFGYVTNLQRRGRGDNG